MALLAQVGVAEGERHVLVGDAMEFSFGLTADRPIMAGETGMADEVKEEEAGDAPDDGFGGDDEDGEASPKKSRAKLLIIIGAAASVILLISVGAGAYLLGYLDSFLGAEEAQEGENIRVQGEVFFKLEEITLNLNEEGKKSRFLRIGLTIVLLHEEDIASIEHLAPRITDFVSTYLRELRPEETTGSAGIFRIRENVLLRVRAAVAPVEVTNVLFNSVLVQ